MADNNAPRKPLFGNDRIEAEEKAATKAATLPGAPEAGGGFEETMRDATLAAFDKGTFGLVPYLNDKFADMIGSNRPRSRELLAAAEARSPIATTVGGAVGTLAPIALTGGVAGAAGVTSALARGAIAGGGSNLIDQGVRAVTEDKEFNPNEAVIQTALGGAAPFVGPGLKAGAKAIASVPARIGGSIRVPFGGRLSGTLGDIQKMAEAFVPGVADDAAKIVAPTAESVAAREALDAGQAAYKAAPGKFGGSANLGAGAGANLERKAASFADEGVEAATARAAPPPGDPSFVRGQGFTMKTPLQEPAPPPPGFEDPFAGSPLFRGGGRGFGSEAPPPPRQTQWPGGAEPSFRQGKGFFKASPADEDLAGYAPDDPLADIARRWRAENPAAARNRATMPDPPLATPRPFSSTPPRFSPLPDARPTRLGGADPSEVIGPNVTYAGTPAKRLNDPAFRDAIARKMRGEAPQPAAPPPKGLLDPGPQSMLGDIKHMAFPAFRLEALKTATHEKQRRARKARAA